MAVEEEVSLANSRKCTSLHSTTTTTTLRTQEHLSTSSSSRSSRCNNVRHCSPKRMTMIYLITSLFRVSGVIDTKETSKWSAKITATITTTTNIKWESVVLNSTLILVMASRTTSVHSKSFSVKAPSTRAVTSQQRTSLNKIAVYNLENKSSLKVTNHHWLTDR